MLEMCLGRKMYGTGGGVRPLLHGICNSRLLFFSFFLEGVRCPGLPCFSKQCF